MNMSKIVYRRRVNLTRLAALYSPPRKGQVDILYAGVSTQVAESVFVCEWGQWCWIIVPD